VVAGGGLGGLERRAMNKLEDRKDLEHNNKLTPVLWLESPVVKKIYGLNSGHDIRPSHQFQGLI